MKREQCTKNLKAQLNTFAHQAHGCGLTRRQRRLKLGQFGRYLKRNNIQIKQIEHIKAKYIKGYIEERLAQGIGKRSLQNDMSAIRRTLEAAGRADFANSPNISNKALGLSGASRDETKAAIPNALYQDIHQKALQKDAGLAASLELARSLGLRGEEAVQCCQSLDTWHKALNKGATALKVVFGTKGGRPRETLVLNRERVEKAVKTAMKIAEQKNGRLIDKPTLKQAMSFWRNHTSRMGLKGKYSPHSLRYAWRRRRLCIIRNRTTPRRKYWH